MYEDSKPSFNWKSFLIKLAIIILLVVLIVKLIPYDKDKNNNGNSTNFNLNLNALKEAGYNYVNANKSSNLVGTKISLKDLEDEGDINTLSDEKGKLCDKDKSYVKINKKNNNLELEIYLLCGSESDKMYVLLNETDSTTSKTTTTTKKTTVKITAKTAVKETTSKTTQATIKTTKTKTYSVIFVSNGGTSVGNQIVSASKKATIPANPTRTGYKFSGWYLANATTQYNFNNAINSNLILSAKWVPITDNNKEKKYTVYFDSKGGTAISNQIVVEGNRVTYPGVVYKTNATFIGWYYGNQEFNFNTRVYSNITLTARYRENKTYTSYVYSAGYDYSMPTSFTITHKLKIPTVISNLNPSYVKITNLKYIRSLNSNADLNTYLNQHFATYEYAYSGNEIYDANYYNISPISNAYVYKSYSDIYDRTVTWHGSVLNQCPVKYNNSVCIYGIIYQVTWEYGSQF